MKYNRSEIMKRAWDIKNANIRLAGRKPTAYNASAFMTFGKCLAQAWAEAKRAIEKAEREAQKANEVETVWAYEVPLWKWHEAELFGVRDNIVKMSQIEKETKKAFKVYGEWIPKSICELRQVVA